MVNDARLRVGHGKEQAPVCRAPYIQRSNFSSLRFFCTGPLLQIVIACLIDGFERVRVKSVDPRKELSISQKVEVIMLLQFNLRVDHFRKNLELPVEHVEEKRFWIHSGEKLTESPVSSDVAVAQRVLR